MKYLYCGPVPSSVSLIVGDDRLCQDVLMLPGMEVEMPAEHEYTRTLLALAYLMPLMPHSQTIH
ncbi:hypothetical protein HNQ59_000678 [Chitinivorax tropicus]|uniref:Uncharacterized protein n=1 Tax=Chitinivorax tropicus TaxID=714531 RepID=A0A840MDN3_9PROT|nr:hypothetical protein [Chitinivorax tropicus]MBB5017414.1 hypothetical protein [Chitinivorax tropicus]